MTAMMSRRAIVMLPEPTSIVTAVSSSFTIRPWNVDPFLSRTSSACTRAASANAPTRIHTVRPMRRPTGEDCGNPGISGVSTRGVSALSGPI